MAKVIWRASNYFRKRDKSWRDRNTGAVTKNVRVIERRGKTDRVILRNGRNYLGREITGQHFYGGRDSTFKKTKSGLRTFQTRVRANKSNAKKPRKSHPRRFK